MGLRVPLGFLVTVTGLAFASVATSGCSGTDGDASAQQDDLFGRGKVPAEWDRTVRRPANEAQASVARRACVFKKGAMPGETLGQELPIDNDIPIKHIVVMMQENRSFDSYFGHLGKFARRSDIESARDDASNPERIDDPTGTRHPWQHAKALCLSDTNHEWSGSHIQYNGGKMDGFFQTNHGFKEEGQPNVGPELLNGERALWWYDERDIPFYYQLASTFAIGDHYHSSLMGPTWPNRDYLYAATSRGVTTNVRPDMNGLDFPNHDALIFDELQRRRVDWMVFVDGAVHVPRFGTFLGPAQILTRWAGNHIDGMEEFYERARNGTLPQVSFIDANIHEDVDGNDEHPPGNIQNGQKFASNVVHALFKSPNWKDTALFITYDEHGGIYDHVAPPAACAPDDIAPDFRSAEDKEYAAEGDPGRFDRLGMRVPFMVISPFTKKGFVSHHVYDHTSITRFIEAKFKVPALTKRDANADALFDFFDFQNPPFRTPPVLPEAVIDQARRAECQALFPK